MIASSDDLALVVLVALAVARGVRGDERVDKSPREDEEECERGSEIVERSVREVVSPREVSRSPRALQRTPDVFYYKRGKREKQKNTQQHTAKKKRKGIKSHTHRE